MDKGMECTCPSHVRRKSSHMQPNQINVVREGFAEVVDLDHDAVHLNRVFDVFTASRLRGGPT